MTRMLALIFSLLYIANAATALGCGRSPRPAAPAAATSSPILLNYENARLSLIDGSLADVQVAAKRITNAADRAGQRSLGDDAANLADARDLAAARRAFATLSEKVIDYHRTHPAEGVAVAYCSLEKKSWLQPIGRIGNPYAGSDMRQCGEFVGGATPSTNRPALHDH